MNDEEYANCIAVRQTLQKRGTTKVAEEFLNKFKDFPAEFPYTEIGVMVFEKIHGIYVAVFGFFAYEHDQNCASPNKNSCYLSYVDSSGQGTKKESRKLFNHEVLLAYFKFIAACGFQYVYLWCCPLNAESQDYIFFCRNNSASTMSIASKREHLMKWYTMLKKKGKNYKIIESYAGTLTAKNITDIPYFEHDWYAINAAAIATKSTNFKDFLQKMKKATVTPSVLMKIKLKDPGECIQLERLLPHDWGLKREDIIDMCEENSWRFDKLCRAMHTTMMIMHHLHQSKQEPEEKEHQQVEMMMQEAEQQEPEEGLDEDDIQQIDFYCHTLSCQGNCSNEDCAALLNHARSGCTDAECLKCFYRAILKDSHDMHCKRCFSQ